MTTCNKDTVFVDMTGNHYLVRDVLGAGDCALLALLHNPRFEAPVSGVDGLRNAIAAFARGERRDQCSMVYSLVGERNGVTFDSYVSQVLQPGFWVGTVLYIWVTMCYGIEIRSHYFNAHRVPEFTSSVDVLRDHLPDAVPDGVEEKPPVHVLFHTYRNMARCNPSSYNHFATLIPIPPVTGATQTLNDEVAQEVKPWWTKVKEVNGYDCSLKEVKDKKGKGKLNKVERKKLNEALTYHYLKTCDDGEKLNATMAVRLEKAQQKEAELAAKLNVDVQDLDVGITSKSTMVNILPTQVSNFRRISDSYDRRNWLQRAAVVFLFLHPQIGAKSSADTASFTGVNENTLLSWIYQKQLIAGWLDVVAAMDARTAIAALPAPIQDLFSHVDPDSTVCVDYYRKKINACSKQTQFLFKGGQVRVVFAVRR